LQIANLFSIKQPCKITQDCDLRDGTRLKLTKIVRVVANKRLVCMGVWQNQAVYAKLFSGAKAAHYAKRDAMGVKALMRAGIATPTLLAQTQSQDASVSVLIFSALTHAENVEEVWAKSNTAERLYLAKKLCQTLGAHHLANLMQTDLYLKNFLLLDDEIVTIDGDGIKQFESLTKDQAMDNLSILLSKFDVLDVKAWRVQLLEAYQTANPQVRLAPHILKKLSYQYRLEAARRYADKKVFRQCTDVLRPKVKGFFIALSSAFASLQTTLDFSQMDQTIASATLLKKGNTCTVALANIDDKSIVVKRYNIKNIGHQFSRFLRKSRAAISWANAHRLQLLGISTPNPVALIEVRHFGILTGKAYFLSEYVDAPDAATFFATTQDKALRADAMKLICQLFYRLHFLGISHGDMKASNLKMLDGKPMLIDLDSMQQHRWRYFAEKAHAKDLRRFMQNWKDDTSLYNGFLKVFSVIYADHTPFYRANILK